MRHIVIFLFESSELISRVVLENIYFKTKQTGEYILNIRCSKGCIIYETTVGVYSLWMDNTIDDGFIGFECDQIYLDNCFVNDKEYINKVKGCFKRDVPHKIKLVDISKYSFLMTK
jgi:hypothetical protein